MSQVVSRPVLYGALIVVGVGLYIWSQQGDAPAKKPTTKKTSKSTVAKIDVDFLPEDYSAHFERPTSEVRNLFLPLVKVESAKTVAAVAVAPPRTDLDKVPAALAGGDANWTYMGYASVNGVDMGLLENKTLKQSAFLKTGELWKAAHVGRITPLGIALTGKDGIEQVVLRYDPMAAAKKAAGAGPSGPVASTTAGANPMPGMTPPDGTVRPFNPGSPLSGPIGPNVQFRPSPAGTVTIIQ